MLVHLNNSILRHHEWMWAALMNRTPCLTHERGINKRYPWLSKYLGTRLKTVISMSKAIRDLMVERGVSGDNIRVMYLTASSRHASKCAAPRTTSGNSSRLKPGQPVLRDGRQHQGRWKGQEVRRSGVDRRGPSDASATWCACSWASPPRSTSRTRCTFGDLVPPDQSDRHGPVHRLPGERAGLFNVMDVVVHASRSSPSRSAWWCSKRWLAGSPLSGLAKAAFQRWSWKERPVTRSLRAIRTN